jgi:DNA polymerase-3 subunit alpha
MKEIERVGLLKMDFLGLSTLTLIFDAIAEIKRDDGVELDIDAIPLDDAKTYQIFQDGQTYGIFQFESSGMRDILRKAKPQRLDDLIALNALYRPGPLRSGMVDDFIARKQGRPRSSTSCRSSSRSGRHLRRHRLPGTGDAHLERARRPSRSARRPAPQGDGQEERRGHGQDARQLRGRREEARRPRRRPRTCFDLMEHFAGVRVQQVALDGVRVPAYQTAYLKANYPWHFAAALLTIEAQNTDKLRCISASAATVESRCSRPTSTRASCGSPLSPTKASASG